MSSSKFNPTLSFDGVAIIIAALTGCLWLGSLSQRVAHQEKMLDDYTITLRALSEGQAQTSRNVATLQQMVSDYVTIKKGTL